jgi:hypothetical protein
MSPRCRHQIGFGASDDRSQTFNTLMQKSPISASGMTPAPKKLRRTVAVGAS